MTHSFRYTKEVELKRGSRAPKGSSLLLGFLPKFFAETLRESRFSLASRLFIVKQAELTKKAISETIVACHKRVGIGGTIKLLDDLCANGMRIYKSNLFTREALARENLAAAIANSSNVHVFYLEGNPVGEAWLDLQAVIQVLKARSDDYPVALQFTNYR